MDFSKIIILRKKKDLSQREMAQILNVSKSTYARLETQEEIIPLIHLIDFCNYFHVTMNFVLGLSSRNEFSKYDYIKVIEKEKIGINIK